MNKRILENRTPSNRQMNKICLCIKALRVACILAAALAGPIRTIDSATAMPPDSSSLRSESSVETTSSSVRASESSSSSASSTLAKKSGDPALLRLSVAQTAYDLEPSLENKANLILAYERLVESNCMQNLLRTLQHPGAGEDARCMEYVIKVFDLDSASPVAFCARDGIDSPNCLAAYKNQAVGSFGEPYRAPADPEPLRPGTRATVQDTVARLYHEVNELSALQSKTPSLGTKLKIRGTYDQLLMLNCAVVRLGLRELPPQNDQANMMRDSLLDRPIDPNLPVEKYVDALVQAHRAKDSAQNQNSRDAHQYGPPYFRNRLVSEACLFYVRAAMGFEPQMGTAICHRDGFSSPSCIQALRKERSATQDEIQKSRALGTPAADLGAITGFEQRPPDKAPGFKTF